MLVLNTLAAASVLFGIISFFILGGRSRRRRTYSGRLFCLFPLSFTPIAGLAEVQLHRSAGGEAGAEEDWEKEKGGNDHQKLWRLEDIVRVYG